ncbi:unnamed protein product [Rotaria sp. Silwood1]|nr:unnamed protein product [Rotaria sp. Silwood1]CAF3723499.1 unnamed protein product [Rotaria sp. Silwood1]CAF3776739.1 unnamed protein product [Rotaria sp. Silwood1]CAF4962199.1 unnamed protein product [Rotaria sp. Silwood1]CAF4988528.1 unnamed protein product [Rotaria sp. Silwood1]
MQANLEGQSRAKLEVLKQKKKLETDINQLEVSLDHANRTNTDLQKTLKRMQQNIAKLQVQIEAKQQQYDEAYEVAAGVERRINTITGDIEELRTSPE